MVVMEIAQHDSTRSVVVRLHGHEVAVIRLPSGYTVKIDGRNIAVADPGKTVAHGHTVWRLPS